MTDDTIKESTRRLPPKEKDIHQPVTARSSKSRRKASAAAVPAVPRHVRHHQ
jgi:hypothetical protein